MDGLIQRMKSNLSRVPKWIFAFLCLFLFAQMIGFELAIQRLEWREEELFAWLLPTFVLSVVLAWVLSLQWHRLRQAAWLKKWLAPAGEGKRIPFWLLWLGCILFWIPYFLIYYPGILCYDFGHQINQYFYWQAYSAHHPLLHTFLMGRLIQLGYDLFGSYNAGAALYTFLQMAAMAAAVACVLSKIQGYRIPRWLLWGMTGFFYVLPVFPVLAISATKDTVFACLFLMAVAAALPLGEKKIGWKDGGVFVVFAAAAALMRNNAVYGYAVLLLLSAAQTVFSKERKAAFQRTGLIFLSIVLALSISMGLETVMDADKGSKREMLSIPAQQMVRTYTYKKDVLPEQDIAFIETYIQQEALDQYDPWLADLAKYYLDMWRVEADPMAFFTQWLSLGSRNLEEYLEAFLIQNEPLWYLGKDSLLEAKECYLEIDFKTDYLEGLRQTRRLESVQTLVNMLMGKTAGILMIPGISLLVHPAVYVWLLLAALAVLLQEGKGRYAYLPLLPLCYCATLLLGPCILPRYCLAAMMATPVILAYLLHRKNQHSYRLGN